MEGYPSPTQVRPLGHRLEMVDGFSGFDLDRTQKLMSLIWRGEYEIRKDLHGPNSYWYRLLLPHVDRHIRATLQSNLKQTDDAVVFELLPNGAHQDRTHLTSRGEKNAEVW